MTDVVVQRLDATSLGDMAPGGGSFIRQRGVVASYLSGDMAFSSSSCDVGACCGRWVQLVMIGSGGGHW